MVVPRAEKAYEKHAWIIFFATGIVILVVVFVELLALYLADPSLKGLSWLTSDPAVLSYIRWGATFAILSAIGFAIFVIGASLTSYRRGERWAWYSFLYLPLFLLVSLVLAYWLWPLLIPLLVLSLLGLFLPYRKFFPKVSATVRA